MVRYVLKKEMKKIFYYKIKNALYLLESDGVESLQF